MSDEIEVLPNDASRRDFLKKSLVTGAVIWSAPVVTSMPGGRAWAQEYVACVCNSSAFGLRVIIPLLSFDQTFGIDGCFADTGVLGIPDTVTVSAQVICGSDASQDGDCSARADITLLDVIVGPVVPVTAPDGTLRVQAGVLHSEASATCDDCVSPVGDSTAASARVAGTAVGGPITVDVDTACNLDVLNLGIVKVNEQTCNPDGSLSVNALHVRFPATGDPLVEVIAAHSQAGSVRSDGTVCPCVTCTTR